MCINYNFSQIELIWKGSRMAWESKTSIHDLTRKGNVIFVWQNYETVFISTFNLLIKFKIHKRNIALTSKKIFPLYLVVKDCNKQFSPTIITLLSIKHKIPVSASKIVSIQLCKSQPMLNSFPEMTKWWFTVKWSSSIRAYRV